jgi:hypothetical protein
MRVAPRFAAAVAVALWAVLGAAPEVAAQDAAPPPVRISAAVEYQGVDGLYLGVGADQGAARGDTVAVYRTANGDESLGRLVFTSVTRRRAVAVAVGGQLALQVGDVVFLPLAPPPQTAQVEDAVPAAAVTTAQPAPAREQGGARISGRLALDFEARETLTSWSGELFGETRRRFATPTSRLSLSVTDLPGGLAIRTNLRASYRYDELAGGPPPVSVRAYELAAVKSFGGFPLELTLGRFSNPYERYSAYWDGALVRVGRESGLGVGVAAGFEPDLHNETFSRSLPKLTAFADFAARGGGWRYDTDASFHVARPTGAAERRYIGWSQRLAVGRLSLDQRLRADDGTGGSPWSLTQLRLRGSLQLVRGLRLRSTYSRSESLAVLGLLAADSLALPVRREATLGLDLSGSAAFFSVEAGRTGRDGDSPGWSVYGNAGVGMGAAQLLLSGRRWIHGDAESWSAAPALALRWSVWEWRAGYRLYRTSDGPRDITSHAAEAQIGLLLARDTRVALRGERQWGESLRGTRLALSLWRSF